MALLRRSHTQSVRSNTEQDQSLSSEEDESAPPRNPGGAGNKGKKKKKKNTRHNHIGPNVRAYRAGLAFCPVCDAEKTLRLTIEELAAEREAKDAFTVTKSFLKPGARR